MTGENAQQAYLIQDEYWGSGELVSTQLRKIRFQLTFQFWRLKPNLLLQQIHFFSDVRLYPARADTTGVAGVEVAA